MAQPKKKTKPKKKAVPPVNADAYQILPRRQQRFVDNVLADLTITDAYIQAGYNVSPNVASAAASRLLRNVNIKKALEQKKAEISYINKVTQDEVLSHARRAISVGFGDSPVKKTQYGPDGMPAGAENVYDVYPALVTAGLNTLSKFMPSLPKDTEGGKPEEKIVTVQLAQDTKDWNAAMKLMKLADDGSE